MDLPPDVRHVAADDGLRIAYRSLGEGPALLAIGDFWGHVVHDFDLAPLAAFWDRLAAQANLILHDRRGTSLSDRLPTGVAPTLKQAARDAQAVLGACGVDEVTVFACASATPLAIQLAVNAPELIKKLVIYNGFARFTQASDQPFGIPPEALADFEAIALQTWGDPEILRIAGPGIQWTDETLAAAAANLRHTASPPMAEALIHLLYEQDMRPHLREVTAEVVIAHSLANPLVPVEHGRALHEALPGSRLVELPGPDYQFWGSDAEKLLQLIERELAR